MWVSKWQEWKSSLVEGKNPCYRCRKKGRDRSGDNFHFYGEGRGGYCQSCEYTIPSDDWLEENGGEKFEQEDEWELDIMTKEFSLEDWNKLKKNCTTNPNGWRGLTEKACKKHGVQFEYDEETGELLRHYCPTTINFKFSGIKVREIPKTFFAKGQVGNDCELYGQWYYRNSNSKFCVILAGEVDWLSAEVILNDKESDYEEIPCLSPVTGETGSHKQLQKQYEFLNRFEKIILCYDSDDAGKQAIEKAVKVLPKGKVYIMRLSLKDTNKYLTEGKSKEWINAFWKAEKYTPSGILGSSGLMDKIKEYAKIEKIPLPPFMYKLQNLMAGGIPLGVIVAMGSASGTGKSTIVDECSYYWYFNSPHKIGVVTLESDSAQYGTNILSRHVGYKINLIDSPEEKLKFLERPEVVEAANKLWYDENGDNRFYIVEDRDGSLEDVKELISNLIISCECKVIVLDPVQDLLEGCSLEEQQSFYKWMKGMVKSHLVTFILIAHVRKSGGGNKANSTGADLHEEDFFGSGSLFKSSACNLLFMRDKENPCEFERNVTRMKATKIRWTGRTSPYAGEYFYDNDTHTMYDKDWYLENKMKPQAV